MVRSCWPSSALSSRPESPPFLWQLPLPTPPVGHDRGVEMVIRQSEHIAYLPGRVGGERSSDTKERLFVSFDSLVTVLRSNQLDDFAWIWIGSRFCAHRHHHFHHLSSPRVIIFKKSHHLFNPGVTLNLFCLFAMVSSSFSSFSMVLLWIFPVDFT